MAQGLAGAGSWWGWRVWARVVPCPVGGGGYLWMRPLAKKL